jgi:hypothetical protein
MERKGSSPTCFIPERVRVDADTIRFAATYG